MNKQTIIKYMEGRATPEEKDMLLEWIRSSRENAEYFSKVRDLWIMSSMPQQEATAEEMMLADRIISGTPASNPQKTIPPIEKKPQWSRIAYYGIAATVLLALCINIALISIREGAEQQPQLQRHLLSHIPANYLHTIYTNRGVKGEVTLPDSSVIKLNSDSKIVFPDKFSGPTREVYVSGEAYFNVATNPDTPMIVTTNRNFKIKVLGTEFNVRSYDNESDARTTLFKGKIDLFTNNNGKEHMLVELSPNQSFVVKDKKELRPLHVMKADTLKFGAWRYGRLVFDQTPMDQVIRELERWHGAEVTVKDKAVYNLKFSASFRQESLVQILDILKFCSEIDYELDENRVTLSLRKR